MAENEGHKGQAADHHAVVYAAIPGNTPIDIISVEAVGSLKRGLQG